jgi:hypothetical protein
MEEKEEEGRPDNSYKDDNDTDTREDTDEGIDNWDGDGDEVCFVDSES